MATASRRFLLPGLVAELRAVLVDPDAAEDELAAAAEQLARLAEAGVPGAHPRDWWGRAPLSTDAPIRPRSLGPVPIRPSKFQAYTDCELRALLMDLGATDATDEVAASLGTLVHWVAEQAEPGASGRASYRAAGAGLVPAGLRSALACGHRAGPGAADAGRAGVLAGRAAAPS